MHQMMMMMMIIIIIIIYSHSIDPCLVTICHWMWKLSDILKIVTNFASSTSECFFRTECSLKVSAEEALPDSF
jgi:hypothetical protein